MGGGFALPIQDARARRARPVNVEKKAKGSRQLDPARERDSSKRRRISFFVFVDAPLRPRTARCAHPSPSQFTPETTLIPPGSNTRTSGRCTRSPRCVMWRFWGGGRPRKEGIEEKREEHEHRVRRRPAAAFFLFFFFRHRTRRRLRPRSLSHVSPLRLTPCASRSLSFLSRSRASDAPSRPLPHFNLKNNKTGFLLDGKRESKKKEKREGKNKQEKIGLFFFKTFKALQAFEKSNFLFPTLSSERLARLILFFLLTLFWRKKKKEKEK